MRETSKSLHAISSAIRRYLLGALEVLLLIPTLPFLLALMMIELMKD